MSEMCPKCGKMTMQKNLCTGDLICYNGECCKSENFLVDDIEDRRLTPTEILEGEWFSILDGEMLEDESLSFLDQEKLIERLTYFMFLLARDHVVIGNLNQALKTCSIDRSAIFGDKALENWAKQFALTLLSGNKPSWEDDKE